MKGELRGCETIESKVVEHTGAIPQQFAGGGIQSNDAAIDGKQTGLWPHHRHRALHSSWNHLWVIAQKSTPPDDRRIVEHAHAEAWVAYPACCSATSPVSTLQYHNRPLSSMAMKYRSPQLSARVLGAKLAARLLPVQ